MERAPAAPARRHLAANDVCRRCSLISLCASCAGAAELEHGDPEAIVAHFCEVTHLRTFALSSSVAGHVPDATCCLGAGGKEDAGGIARQRPRRSRAAACGSGASTRSGSGTGGCGSSAPAPLIQIGRRPA